MSWPSSAPRRSSTGDALGGGGGAELAHAVGQVGHVGHEVRAHVRGGHHGGGAVLRRKARRISSTLSPSVVGPSSTPGRAWKWISFPVREAHS